jgi:hypothetical protein
MSSLIEYRKEFEDYILNGNLEEALKTLVPNSKEQIYLQFCDEYKKCVALKKITPELNKIIDNASSQNISMDFIDILDIKRDLLEYDLPSTSQDIKEDIINYLSMVYCTQQLDYDAPFFVREKKTKDGLHSEKVNNTPLLLTEKMISDAIEKEIKKKSNDKKHKIANTPYNRRHKLFLEYLKKGETELCIDIIFRGTKIPFYLMTKDEFSEVITFFNEATKNIALFDYSSLTVEQITRLLKEIKNEKYINTKDFVYYLMKKKYNELFQEFKEKNNLKELKKILLELYDLFNEYCTQYASGVLLYILKINKEINIYDIKPLLKYLENPIIEQYNSDQQNFYIKKLTNKNSTPIINIPDISFYIISKHKFIEDLLIKFLVFDKAKKDDFSKYFKQEYLDKIECIAKMYKGEDVKSEVYSKYLSETEFKNMAKNPEISICEHNPKVFKIDEDVKVDIDFKNVKSINISIYEINTENYYLDKKAPLNSLINVEGIIASQTMDIKIEGGENPLKYIRKTIELDQIKKGKPGVFLVEILGNGISSRIIIKKGRLNLISRNTSEGILCQIINEKHEILKDDKTYLWYNGIKFNCEPKEGLILIPYKILSNSDNKYILVHDSYADITEIERKTENFKLKGYFNLLNESIIPGNMLKVNFKPLLFLNGREVSLELIKKGTITVEMTKSENDEKIPITNVFENVTFKDDNKEYEFEVLIPPMMLDMKFSFNCDIYNSTKGENQSMSYNQNSDFNSSNFEISYPFLHKIGNKYVYEILGRNGENIVNKAGTNTNVTIYTNYYLSSVDICLQYDQQGKLNLGELKNVRTIKINNTTYNLSEYAKYCYPEKIDIIKGESFTLPIYSTNNISLDNYDYFQLYQYYTSPNDPSELKDIKKEINLKKLDINGDKEHYYEFSLGKTLPIGKYYLIFGDNNDTNKIIIEVREGKHWMNFEDYIVNDNEFIENSQNKTPIYMKNLLINKEKGEIKFECAQTRRDIKYTHANIYLSQYLNPELNVYFNKYWNMLNEGVENIINNKFSIWKNIYLSNRVLNEEIEYILQRRNFENQLGNSLQMPSLLLKRAYKRDCENEEEKLEEGAEYEKIDAKMGNRKPKMARAGKEEGKQKGANTDFYNFLKNSGYVLNNIEPININSNDNMAKFEIKFSEKDKDILKKYSYIHIILVDNKSISSDFHCLCKDNEKYEIEKRNISNDKVLDNSKNLTEIKKTELIKKGENFNINETSKYKLVDSVQKLSNFYLLTLTQKDKYWNKFKFLLNLNEDKFNEEDFLEKYNEVCGHEINLFLYFKYPKLFNKYIKGILKYKFEKTFIDYFLLDDYETLIQYLTPLKINKLSTDELCLLILKIVEKKPEEAKK